MTTNDSALDVFVASFITKEQYLKFEEVFDSFGGRFVVKKDEEGVNKIYSDQVGKDLFDIMLAHSSITFLI